MGVEGTHNHLVIIARLPEQGNVLLIVTSAHELRVLGRQGVEHLPVHRVEALVIVTKAGVTGAGEILEHVQPVLVQLSPLAPLRISSLWLSYQVRSWGLRARHVTGDRRYYLSGKHN